VALQLADAGARLGDKDRYKVERAMLGAILGREALDVDALELPDSVPAAAAQRLRGGLLSVTQQMASVYPDLQLSGPDCNLGSEWPVALLMELYMLDVMERVVGVQEMAVAGALARQAADRVGLGLQRPARAQRRWMARAGELLASVGRTLARAGLHLRLRGAPEAGGELAQAGLAIQECARHRQLEAAPPRVARHARAAARHLRKAADEPAHAAHHQQQAQQAQQQAQQQQQAQHGAAAAEAGGSADVMVMRCTSAALRCAVLHCTTPALHQH
jgi:hypothetical protein